MSVRESGGPGDSEISYASFIGRAESVDRAGHKSETTEDVSTPLLEKNAGAATSPEDSVKARQTLKDAGAKFYQSAKITAKESLVDILRLGGGALLVAAAIPILLVGGVAAVTQGIVEKAKKEPTDNPNYGKELMKFAVSSATTGAALMLVSAVDVAMSTVRRISQSASIVAGKQINDAESSKPAKVQEPLNYARLLAVKTIGGSAVALSQKITGMTAPSNRWMMNIISVINLDPNKAQKKWLSENLEKKTHDVFMNLIKTEEAADEKLAHKKHKEFLRVKT